MIKLPPYSLVDFDENTISSIQTYIISYVETSSI